MKYSDIFKNRLGCENEDEVFNYLLSNMKETIRGWDFFVAWDKVTEKVKSIETALGHWNRLVGKENIREEFKSLLAQYPEIAEVLPSLLAVREKSIKVLDPLDDNVFNYKEYVFGKKKKYGSDEIELLADFAEKTGILSMLENLRRRISTISWTRRRRGRPRHQCQEKSERDGHGSHCRVIY